MELPPAIAAALTLILATLAAEGVRVELPDDLERAFAERPELAARLQRRRVTTLLPPTFPEAVGLPGRWMTTPPPNPCPTCSTALSG